MQLQRTLPIHRRASRAGLTLIEVTIALAVVATVLIASAGSFSTSLSSARSAHRTSEAASFLQSVMEDVAAQPYDNLLSLNGQRVYDTASASTAQFAADLTVFTAAVDLVQVEAVAIDMRTNQETGRVVTQRSDR